VRVVLYLSLEGIANIKVKLAVTMIPRITIDRIAPIDADGTDWKLDSGSDTDVSIKTSRAVGILGRGKGE
jgi:hypothetical protein